MQAPASAPYPRFWKTVGRRPASWDARVRGGEHWAPGERPLRLVVVGKGGAGKSVLAGTMARLLARGGHRVLALDTDTMPGMARSLGVASPPRPPLADAVEAVEHGCWRLRKGIGPVRAVRRFSTLAPDGVRVLEVGDQVAGGNPPITPSVQGFYQVVHGLPTARALRGWTMIGDHPAGPRQTAHDWAPYADTLLVVSEPTWKSALTARRLAELADGRGTAVVAVATKVEGPGDRGFVEKVMGRPVAGSVPADEAVAATDRRGEALIDHAPDSPAVAAIQDLVDGLTGAKLASVVAR